jgi:hypothetical protein
MTPDSVGFLSLLAVVLVLWAWQSVDARRLQRAVVRSREESRTDFVDNTYHIREVEQRVSDRLNDASDRIDKIEDRPFDEPHPDTVVHTWRTVRPTQVSHWFADNEYHSATAALLPIGGGVELAVSNGGMQAVRLTWQEYDVLVEMARALRPLDPFGGDRVSPIADEPATPPEAVAVFRRTVARSRAAWDQDIPLADDCDDTDPDPDDDLPADCPAGDCRTRGACQSYPCRSDSRKPGGWEDPDVAAE